LGLPQVKGLKRVPEPPAIITAFKAFTPFFHNGIYL